MVGSCTHRLCWFGSGCHMHIARFVIATLAAVLEPKTRCHRTFSIPSFFCIPVHNILGYCVPPHEISSGYTVPPNVSPRKFCIPLWYGQQTKELANESELAVPFLNLDTFGIEVSGKMPSVFKEGVGR